MNRGFRWRELAKGVIAVAMVASSIVSKAIAGDSYDPMAATAGFKPEEVELVLHDARRSRDIPVRVYLPSTRNAAPVVVFSHGLGGARSGSEFLGEHWAARGYLCVFLQHPGSDDSVWRDKRPLERMSAMKRAASLENFLLRVDDVSAALDQLQALNSAPAGALSGRLDMERIAMSGHSFGAVTTEAVSGQSFTCCGQKFTDARIKAAIVMSPSTPTGGWAEQAFALVTIPWMLMTGTKDLAPIGHADMKSRLGVYPALVKGPKYEVVLDNAEHSAFTDRRLPGDREPRNPNHHRVILALSTAFLDAYLRGDNAALAWLNSNEGPRTVLENADRWQFSAHGSH
jgi:predicted dienelactone hydrolase